MGPIRAQADSVNELLTSPATRIHVVTLLEEMPVQETIDAVAELRGLGMAMGAIVVNQARSADGEDFRGWTSSNWSTTSPPTSQRSGSSSRRPR
jgi:hypothetical protein